jgi:two-component sensor histidine kinase
MADVLRTGVSVRQQEVHIERPDVPSGRLRVEWSRGETDLVLRWSETDGPLVKPPARQGFGTRIVNRVIETDLEGKLRFDWNPDGIACELVVPVAQLADS